MNPATSQKGEQVEAKCCARRMEMNKIERLVAYTLFSPAGALDSDIIACTKPIRWHMAHQR
jgi:hypothetical protein